MLSFGLSSTTLKTLIDYVALLLVFEIFAVSLLAAKKHASKLQHPMLQRAGLRVMLIGPVYSAFVWLALAFPSLDYFCSIPVGAYEGYAMLSFFEILVVYVGGEHKATLALNAQQRSADGHTCKCYYTCALCCSQPNMKDASTASYISCLRLRNGRSLYEFLKLCVAQYIVTKPLISTVMLMTYEFGNSESSKMVEYLHLLRVFNVITLCIAAQALLQMYSAVLPRLRGFGGERVFLLLSLVMVVIIVQEFLATALVLDSAYDAWKNEKDLNFSMTTYQSIRILCTFTILEFTVFTNIFYRYFVPEVFEVGASLMWYPGREKSMTTTRFVKEVLTFTSIFDGDREWIERAHAEHLAAQEEKLGAAEEETSEFSRLLSS